MIKAPETAGRMKLLPRSRRVKFLSLILSFGVTFIAFAPLSLRAAELIMFEDAGCAWCMTFNREIAPVYAKTAEGARAPLRRLTMGQPLPSDLAFVRVERLTPLFILVDKGREVGRIRGYPGEDHFWGLLGVLIRKLDTPGTTPERAQRAENILRAAN